MCKFKISLNGKMKKVYIMRLSWSENVFFYSLYCSMVYRTREYQTGFNRYGDVVIYKNDISRLECYSS